MSPDVQDPTSPGTVAQVLEEACPNWSVKEQTAAHDKLLRLGVEHVGNLAELLVARGSRGLNAKLKANGLKTFSSETLSAFRRTLELRELNGELVTPRLRSALCECRDACGWSHSDCKAAEEKLATVGATSSTEFLTLFSTLGASGLNSNLRHHGLKPFARDTLIQLRRDASILVGSEDSVYLEDFLQVHSQWGFSDVMAAMDKLKKLGIASQATLAEALALSGKNELNRRLHKAFLKPFATSTLTAWRRELGISRVRRPRGAGASGILVPDDEISAAFGAATSSLELQQGSNAAASTGYKKEGSPSRNKEHASGSVVRMLSAASSKEHMPSSLQVTDAQYETRETAPTRTEEHLTSESIDHWMLVSVKLRMSSLEAQAEKQEPPQNKPNDASDREVPVSGPEQESPSNLQGQSDGAPLSGSKKDSFEERDVRIPAPLEMTTSFLKPQVGSNLGPSPRCKEDSFRPFDCKLSASGAEWTFSPKLSAESIKTISTKREQASCGNPNQELPVPEVEQALSSETQAQSNAARASRTKSASELLGDSEEHIPTVDYRAGSLRSGDDDAPVSGEVHMSSLEASFEIVEAPEHRAKDASHSVGSDVYASGPGSISPANWQIQCAEVPILFRTEPSDDEMPSLTVVQPETESDAVTSIQCQEGSLQPVDMSAGQSAECSKVPKGSEAAACDPPEHTASVSDDRQFIEELFATGSGQACEQVASGRDNQPKDVVKGEGEILHQLRRGLKRGGLHDPRNHLVHCERRLHCRRLTVVPMGQMCPTAAFLRGRGWHGEGFPLDWCCATFKVWDHILSDGFSTLMGKPIIKGKEVYHPYNFKFKDTMMFFHHEGWATDQRTRAAMKRRTERLQKILREAKAFGVAFYFEGRENVHQTLSEVVDDAIKLAVPMRGFEHVVLVWFHQMESFNPKWQWEKVNNNMTLLRYTPRRLMGWGFDLHPIDEQCIAKLFREHFPDMFSNTSAEEEAMAEMSSEDDGDIYAGWDVNWNLRWDFDKGQIRL